MIGAIASPFFPLSRYSGFLEAERSEVPIHREQGRGWNTGCRPQCAERDPLYLVQSSGREDRASARLIA
jgi:hypothetical protein